MIIFFFFFFFFSSRRRHTRYIGDWSSDVCSSDLPKRPLQSIFPVSKVLHLKLLSNWVIVTKHIARQSLVKHRRILSGRGLISRKPPPGDHPHSQRVRAIQIGRASCRERV